MITALLLFYATIYIYEIRKTNINKTLTIGLNSNFQYKLYKRTRFKYISYPQNTYKY